jgi:hypothetical protein
MKKKTYSLVITWKPFVVALLSFLMLLSVVAQSGQIMNSTDIKITYFFENPTIETIDIAGTLYNRVTLPDCYPASRAGEPKLPSKGAFLLLPPRSEINRIDITVGEKSILGLDRFVEPTSQAIPLSQTEDIPIPTPTQSVYQSNSDYPGALYTHVGVYRFRGFDILVLLLHPVHYNPVTGDLIWYTSLEVSVETTPTGVQSEFFRGSDKDRTEVNQKVDNPWVSSLYMYENVSSSASFENYDLLVITTDALQSGFVPLKEAHDATGVSTVIKTLTDIGSSNLESIRNYIRDAYTNWGIDYVLIGGDTDVVPAATLWVSGMDENVTYYETTMPSDLYYACLDGPYNYNGNNKWGEPTDGEGGGDVDLIAEVYVGRATVGSMTEVNNFVTKTVAYINKDFDDEYLKKVCLAGEYLGNYGIASYGGTYLDQLVNGSSDDGYTTVGIPADEYNINKLYDAPGYDWPKSAIVSVINNGVHIINHLGHANYNYNLKMYTSDVNALANPSNRTCFIYSQGCMAGGFDNGDCIAEYFTVKTPRAAFAVVMNARYGWFWSYSTDGDSQRFHRQFWDAIFGENIKEIGRANHDSKEDNLPIIGRSCIRWCYYQTNLFGDPALRMIGGTNQNHPPEKPSMPSGPTQGITGVSYTFTTSATDPDAGDQLYYQWDWGDDVSDWFGPYSSGYTVEATHSWPVVGEYQIKVKARDGAGLESEWSDPLTIHIDQESCIQIETISGGFGITAEISNTGVVDATLVTWTISLQGLILFGQSNSGTIFSIDAGDSVGISTGFLFGLGPIDILVTAADAEKKATALLLGPFIFNVKDL